MSVSTTLVKGVAPDAIHCVLAAAADDVLRIGAQDYTFAADPTGTAFQIDIGSDADDQAANIIAAINASGTDDDEYGEGTTAHPEVVASQGSDASLITLTARLPGVHINGLALERDNDDTQLAVDAAVFGEVSGATLGSGAIYTFVLQLLNQNQVNSEVQSHLKVLTEAAD